MSDTDILANLLIDIKVEMKEIKKAIERVDKDLNQVKDESVGIEKYRSILDSFNNAPRELYINVEKLRNAFEGFIKPEIPDRGVVDGYIQVFISIWKVEENYRINISFYSLTLVNSVFSINDTVKIFRGLGLI